MTPDEVVKILSNSQIQLISDIADKEFCGEALSSAISLIQDYQKLRERVSVESCKYAVISHGIGISGEVEEIKVHCKRDSENDYTEFKEKNE